MNRRLGILLALFLGNVIANTVGINTLADSLFAAELAFLFVLLKRRCHSGRSCGRSGRSCSLRNQSSAALAFDLWFARVFHSTLLAA